MRDRLSRDVEIRAREGGGGGFVETLAGIEQNRKETGSGPEIGRDAAVDERHEGVEAGVLLLARGRRKDDRKEAGSGPEISRDAAVEMSTGCLLAGVYVETETVRTEPASGQLSVA